MRLGQTELIMLLALAVLLFGGSRLAGIGKGIGQSIREFKKEIHKDSDDAAVTEEHVDEKA